MQGPRICIMGNAGSGKSTLAKAVGEALAIPTYHLDRLLLRDNFEKVPYQEYMKAHTDMIAGTSWVADGNYESVFDDRIGRATLVVFLDVSRFITLPRVFKRSRNRHQNDLTIPDGAKRSHVSWKFFRWTATYSRRRVLSEVRTFCQKHDVPLLVVRSGSREAMLQEVLKSAGS